MPNQLNVVFHGTFGFINWGSFLEVLVPDVTHHVYKAGTWLKELDLVAGTTYNLVGVTAEAAVPPLDDLGIAVASGKRNIRRDGDLVRLSLVLPAPFGFAAKRCFQRSDNETIFVGDDATENTTDLATYATTHVAMYHCPDPTKVALLDLGWVPEPDEDGIVNLHVFAEPDDPEMLDNDHIHNSLREVMHLFHARVGLRRQMDATFDEVECPDSADVDGLPAEQEKSLAARALPLGTGTDPANCASGGDDNKGN